MARFTKKTKKMIDAFLVRYPRAEWGPAHAVLSDYNLEDNLIQNSIQTARAALTHSAAGLNPEDIAIVEKMGWYSNHSDDELRATIEFLEQLRKEA